MGHGGGHSSGGSSGGYGGLGLHMGLHPVQQGQEHGFGQGTEAVIGLQAVEIGVEPGQAGVVDISQAGVAVLDKAKMLYEKDQDESNNYISNRAKENQERTNKYNESVELAVSNLLASVPGAQAQEKRIRGFLTPDAVLGMFFNNDGTLKTDAPENLWLVADLEAILSGKAQRIKEKVEQDASRDRLKRTSEKAVAPKRGPGVTAKDKETTGLQKARSVLDSLGF